MTDFVGSLVLVGIISLLYLTTTRGMSANSPAIIWLGAWAAAIVIFLVFRGPYEISGAIALVVLCMVASFAVGAVVAQATGRQARNQVLPAVTFNRGRLAGLQWICVAGGLAGAVTFARELGTPTAALLNPGKLVQSSAANAALIFQGEVAQTATVKLGFAALQLGFVLAGFELSELRRFRGRQLVRYLALIGTALLFTLLSTQRSFLLVPIVWTVAAWNAGLLATGRRLRLSPKIVARVSVAIVVLIGGAVLMRAIRTGSSAAEAAEASEYRTWVAGYLPGLEAWYSEWDNEPTLGTELSIGLRALVGTVDDPDSDDNLVRLANGDTTNALTLLRFLIADIGVAGSALALGAAGFVTDRMARRVAISPVANLSLVVGSLAAILWSPNSWFFGYGGRLLVLAAVALVSRSILDRGAAKTLAAGSAGGTQRRLELRTRRQPGRPSVAAFSS